MDNLSLCLGFHSLSISVCLCDPLAWAHAHRTAPHKTQMAFRNEYNYFLDWNEDNGNGWICFSVSLMLCQVRKRVCLCVNVIIIPMQSDNSDARRTAIVFTFLLFLASDSLDYAARVSMPRFDRQPASHNPFSFVRNLLRSFFFGRSFSFCFYLFIVSSVDVFSAAKM